MIKQPKTNQKVRIYFTQFYTQPNVNFSFSGKFLTLLQRDLNRKWLVPDSLYADYPKIKEIVFRINASSRLKRPRTRFIAYYRKEDCLEIFLDLPFARDLSRMNQYLVAIEHLVDGVAQYLIKHGIDPSAFQARRSEYCEKFSAAPAIYSYRDFDD